MVLTKLSDESDNLYTSMSTAAQNSEEGLKKVFFQQDLQGFAAESATTLGQLMILIQELLNHSLLRTSRLSGSLCWSTRPRAAAESIRGLTVVEKMIYGVIEDAHASAMWVRDIKRKAGLDKGKEGDKAISRLETLRLIKNVKTVRAPTQKHYMLFHLVPSDDVTGGSFFDGGDLDESLIEELRNLVVFHVRMSSWSDGKVRRPRKGAESPDHIQNAPTTNGEPPAKKRRRETNDIEDGPAPALKHTKHRSSRHDPETDVVTVQIPYVAHSRPYPTCTDIHAFITTSDAIRASKATQLTTQEIQNVIDVLVWDEKLEKIGDGFRTVRGVSFRPPGMGEDDDSEDEDDVVGNGLTQAPCGRCPVFDLCTEDGPVNARSCVYWQEWIDAGK